MADTDGCGRLPNDDSHAEASSSLSLKEKSSGKNKPPRYQDCVEGGRTRVGEKMEEKEAESKKEEENPL